MKSHNSGILTTTFVVYDCFYPFFPLYTEDSHVVQVRAEGPKVPEAARPERAEAYLRKFNTLLYIGNGEICFLSFLCINDEVGSKK